MPFDFSVISNIATAIISPVFITMSDGVNLAVYKSIPQKTPKAIIVFFHGAGFYSGPLYQKFANNFSQQNIAVALVDIRGHGRSQGARGDTPSKERVWLDVSEVVQSLKKDFFNVPIYLGGHSSGCGLVLNYMQNKKDNHKIQGLIMLAPYLGHSANSDRKITDQAQRFVKSISWFSLFTYIFSGGWLCTHRPTIFFNYPENLIKNDELIIDFYTNEMSAAVTPNDAKKALENLNTDLFVFIGSNDEQIDPEKTKDFIKINCTRLKYFEILHEVKHLDIALKVPNLPL